MLVERSVDTSTGASSRDFAADADSPGRGPAFPDCDSDGEAGTAVGATRSLTDLADPRRLRRVPESNNGRSRSRLTAKGWRPGRTSICAHAVTSTARAKVTHQIRFWSKRCSEHHTLGREGDLGA